MIKKSIMATLFLMTFMGSGATPIANAVETQEPTSVKEQVEAPKKNQKLQELQDACKKALVGPILVLDATATVVSFRSLAGSVADTYQGLVKLAQNFNNKKEIMVVLKEMQANLGKRTGDLALAATAFKKSQALMNMFK